MMRRSRMALLLWAVILVVALATGRILLFRLTYLLLAVIVLSFLWTWFNVHWVRLVRQTRSRRAQVGQMAEERFFVRNTGFLPKLWLEVRDGSELPGHRVSRVINSLGAGRQHSWSVRTFCRRRGRFTLGPITLASGDPLGLFRMERHLTATSTMIVYPAVVELPGFAPPVGHLAGGDAMRRRTHYITTNVSGVRDYAPGDSFNRIHWLSTARTGRLIVKEFELDPTADIWLVLDMERDVHTGTGVEEYPEEMEPAMLWKPRPRVPIDPSTEEYGVTIAASLAGHFLAQHRAVGLITYGQTREVLQVDRGDRQLAKILEALAVIRAQGRVALEQALTAEERKFGRNTTVIIITPSTSEEWVSAVRDLKRRGIGVVAVLLEASTFGQAPSTLGTMSSLVASEIPTYLVKKGVPLDVALSQRTG
ncbi:MAG: DUF58 domain-containing protein [Anaerolineae bacterium]